MLVLLSAVYVAFGVLGASAILQGRGGTSPLSVGACVLAWPIFAGAIAVALLGEATIAISRKMWKDA